MGKYEEKATNIRWEQLLELFKGMPDPVWWIDRFRVQYYLDANLLIGLHGAFRYTARCLAILINDLSRIVLTLPRKARDWPVPLNGIIYLLDDNPTYLSTMLPVINRAMTEGDTVTVVARKRHREYINARLSTAGKGGSFQVLTYEDLALTYSRGRKLQLLLGTLAGSVRDLAVWLRSAMPMKWMTAPRFISFALVNRFYDSAAKACWGGASNLVAANDHFKWEALLFDSTGPRVRSQILQHGVLPRFAVPNLAHRYLVWGEIHRDIMVAEMGSSPESVIVTGAPGFDDLIQRADERSQSTKDTFCFFSQSHGAALIGEDGYRAAVELFCGLAKRYSSGGMKFLLKLHPRDEDGSVREFEDLYGEWITVTREDLLPILDRSLVTCTVDSTAMFESVIMDVPVIQLKPPGIIRFTDFSTDGLTILCSDMDDLAGVFEKTILDVIAYSRTVAGLRSAAALYLANPGRAAEAIFNNIIE